MAKQNYIGKSLEDLQSYRQKQVRAMLRKEFAAFFTQMTSNTATWPRISDQELVEALADSLLDMGNQRGLGVALLQTFVHELQDRINQSLN